MQHEISSALVTGATEHFAATHFLPRSSVKICETIVRGIPRSSFNSRTINRRFSLIAARTFSTFSGVLFVEGLPERRSLSTDSRPSLKRLYHNFIWASFIESSTKASLIIGIVSADECLKFQAKLDADSLIYSLGHCESDGRTVHRLCQRRPTNDWLAPRESDFTDAQKVLLWLAARLHQGHATGSRDIKYGWILSGQTSYILYYIQTSFYLGHCGVLHFRPFGVMAGSALLVTKAIAICCESGPTFYFRGLYLIVIFYSSYLRKVLER